MNTLIVFGLSLFGVFGALASVGVFGGRWRWWGRAGLAFAVGLLGIFLTSKFRRVILLQVEAWAARAKEDYTADLAVDLEQAQSAADNLAASAQALARADSARRLADRAAADRIAATDAIKSPTPADLRAVRFNMRRRARNSHGGNQ